jgi:GNAT superfamily N-acetyltransferase
MKTEIIVADYHNPEHAADIVRLLSVYALDPMGGGSALEPEALRRLVPELAKRPYAFTVLAYARPAQQKNESQDSPMQAVGLINCFESFSTFAARPLINIHDVVVEQAWRGMGLSQQMLRKVEDMARKRGCCKLTLELLEGNASARQAYARFGFRAYTLDARMGHAVFWQKKLESA